MEAVIAGLARSIAGFEQQIMREQVTDTYRTLEAIFLLWHEVLTIRTIAAQSCEVVTRMTTLAPRVLPAEDRTLIDDLVDQFNRVRSLCSGELDFLQGVIDFYQIPTTTKMNIALERLTLLSVLMLPITAIASLYGMNIIVFDDTNWFQLTLVAVVMLTMITVLFYWAKRQGWW